MVRISFVRGQLRGAGRERRVFITSTNAIDGIDSRRGKFGIGLSKVARVFVAEAAPGERTGPTTRR
jgi:hypothetical protein